MPVDRAARKDELRDYVLGLVSALVLTGIPFALVAWTRLPVNTLLWTIAACGALQVIAHLRFFLHINLSKQKRDDLHLILFTIMIVLLMAGGTLWILFNLHARMM
jgi:cytochrome o ubiquinol oxidase operon protein cyoD